MSDKMARAFLEDIIAHPDDDTPRLIYADWLDEHGDPDRAEFIRVQIELAHLPRWDARTVRLRFRQSQLLSQHDREWREPYRKLKGVQWGSFRRGFIATGTCSKFSQLNEKRNDWLSFTPIEAITIRWPRKSDNIENIRPIPGLRELDIQGRLVVHRDMDRLAETPLLTTVRVLHASQGHIGSDGFHRLLQSPHLQNLTALRLPFNSIGDGGIEALYDSVSLSSLQELDLSEWGAHGRYGEDPCIRAEGMEALAAWPGLARLRTLALSGNDVQRSGLRALLTSPHVAGLKNLYLVDNGLRGPAMQEFGSAHAELRLDFLNLSRNLLRDSGAVGLANAPCLSELKVLELQLCEIQASGARRLAKSAFIDNLRELNVDFNRIGPKGLHSILKAQPKCLHTLLMNSNELGDEGATHLASSSASTTLLQVGLIRNGLGDGSAKVLALSNNLTNLLQLDLAGNPINHPAGIALAHSSLGKRLDLLTIDSLTSDGDSSEIPF